MQTRYAPTLFLPSIESEDFLVVANVSREEATAYAGLFSTLVESKRRMKNNDNAVDDVFTEITGNLNLISLVNDESLALLVEDLSLSKLKGQRGRRAVFVDIENDYIGVGTTVIYNANWAMKGVADPSLLGTVLDAVEEAQEAA